MVKDELVIDAGRIVGQNYYILIRKPKVLRKQTYGKIYRELFKERIFRSQKNDPN